MKREGQAKHFILAILFALVGYIVLYQTIEYQRIRKGPWQVTFNQSTAGAPAIIIAQPWLAITNVRISFPGELSSAASAAGTVAVDHTALKSPASNYQSPVTAFVFAEPRPVPYEVPFGKCIFMDTTFLPGTITFELFGHEIELLPRALIIDRAEHRWQANTTITLPRAAGTLPQTKP